MLARLLLTLALVCIVAVVSADINGRIVGGELSNSAQFPYQVSLRINNRHTCGGSIIDNKWILTASHCIVDMQNNNTVYPPELFNIRAGSHNRIAGGVIVQVKRIIANENYTGTSNDVALLELEEPLVYSSKIQPIALETEEVPEGAEIIISGWGLEATNADSLPITMKWNTVTALSKSSCAKKILQFSNSLICLNHPKGAGACSGDSGGPAAHNGKLAGVAGFVVLGCGSSRPDGYAKVSYHIDWIHKNMATAS